MKLTILTLTSLAFFTIIPMAFADDITAIKNAATKKSYNGPTQTETGKDLITWYRLRHKDTISFHEATYFISSHPSWPHLTSIRKKAEEAINASIPSQEIIQWFTNNPPLTGNGMKHYMNALIAHNKTAQAMQNLKNWWVDATLSPNDQSMIIHKFGRFLGSQDHERRLRSIIHDKHYTASRQLAKILKNGYPQLVEAKIALIEQKSNANQKIAKVPASLRNNEALMLSRIQWRRKNDNDLGAIDLLNRAPTFNRMSNPDDWWKERHIMTRRLIEQQKWGSAYKLVKNHRQQDGLAHAQAEFLSGWIALRKIGKPWEAFKHFEKLFNTVKSPISRARGSYWAGLASETLGHPEIAMQWYQVSAKFKTTYYGQMAAARIQLPIGLSETEISSSPSDLNLFYGSNEISAATLLDKSGQKRDAKLFILAHVKNNKNGFNYKQSADFASKLGLDDTAVKIAKMAERDGYIMPSYLFPVIEGAKTHKFAIHPAFSHGIMRQESAFDKRAKSHAGALGLMQLMPATAREISQKANLRYSKTRLTTDPVYNMTLGSLYIKQMLDRFDGNRTLAIASYNAGPGRVSRWIKEFGDPRDPNIDEVDWIETIPIYETRNYVQRVTEAVNIYAKLF